MIHGIRIDCCLGLSIPRKGLVYVENVNTISGRLSHEYDTDISQSLSAGLQNCQYNNDMEIVGAILNPLFKCDDHMIKTRLCTQEKLQDGKEELLDRMARLFE